jgi:hypothetical protein
MKVVGRGAVERVAEANGWEMMWLADEGLSGAVPPESRKRFKVRLRCWRLVWHRRWSSPRWTE